MSRRDPQAQWRLTLKRKPAASRSASKAQNQPIKGAGITDSESSVDSERDSEGSTPSRISGKGFKVINLWSVRGCV